MKSQFTRQPNRTLTLHNSFSILFSLLFLVLPLVYWPGLFEAASLPRYFLIALVSSLTLALWAIARTDKPLKWHYGFSFILGFFGWAAISISWSADSGTSLIDITQLFSMILVAFLAMQMSDSTRFISILITCILAGAALTASIGLGQYFGFNPLELRMNRGTIPATFINPNHAAVYFDAIPWLAFTAILFHQRTWQRWLASISLGVCLAYITTTSSRGSLLALLASALIFIYLVIAKPEIRVWLKDRLSCRYKEIIFAILIPMMVILLPTGSPVKPSNTITLIEGKLDRSTNNRIAMYLNSLPAIQEHPLTGLGYGGMRVGFIPYSSSIKPITFRTEDVALRELHSDPLQYFVELGLPGGILAIVIFLILLRSGWKTLSYSTSTEGSLISLGFWLSIIAIGTHALVDFPLRLPTSAAFFWLYAGVLLGMGTTHQLQLNRKIIRPLLSFIGMTGVVFSVFFYKNYLSANGDLYNSLVNLKKGECVAAAEFAGRGTDTFSSDFMLHTAYAQIYSVCSFPPAQKMAAMNRVLSLDPSNMRARLTRGELFNQANQTENAIAEFEIITHALPHRPYAYAGLGDSARLQGDILRARHYYLAALKRKPDYQYAIRQLAKLEEVTQN